jgi:hypothetical protein
MLIVPDMDMELPILVQPLIETELPTSKPSKIERRAPHRDVPRQLMDDPTINASKTLSAPTKLIPVCTEHPEAMLTLLFTDRE